MLNLVSNHSQVDKEEAARLSAMPSMVVQLEPSRYTYILPPILYPDGKHYLKFGAHDLSRELRTKESIDKNTSRPKQYEYLQEDVTNHYRIGPDPSHVRKLVN